MGVNLVMTAKAMQDEAAWLALRGSHIGGSDAAVIVGMNNWKAPLALWLEKTGQAEPEDLSGNMRVQFGSYAEEFVARSFCRETGKKVHRTGVYVNSKYPWACASIDRMLVGENTFLECKTAAGWKKDQWQDAIPPAYYCQIQHYMAVLNIPYCYIACMFGNGEEFIWHKVDRDEESISALMKAEEDFWQRVQEKTMPDVDGTESCTQALQKTFSDSTESSVALESAAMGILDSLKDLERVETDIKAQIDERKNRLCAMLGENEIGEIGLWRVTWKPTKPRVTIDSKRLKEELPNVYEKYMKVGNPSRRFAIKEMKE